MLELETPHPNTVVARRPRPGPEVDLEALGAHYKRTHARLHMHAVSIVGSSDLADDIVQEAFAIATAKIRQGAEIRNLNAWMKTVVRNLSIDGLARKGRERRTFTPLPDEPQTAGPASPPEIVHLKERCGAVYREVGQLTPAQRSAFVLAQLRGLSYAEIASDLQRSEQAVRDLLSRARHRIREAVGPDITSLNVPLAGIHFRGLIEPRGRAHAVGDYVAAKLANLQATVASLLQRSAEFVGQPAAPLVAGALVAGGLTLAVSGPQTQIPAAGGGAAPVAVAPESSPSAGSVSSGNERAAVRGAGARPAIARPAPALVGDAGGKPETPSTGRGDRESRPDSTDTDKMPRPAAAAAAPHDTLDDGVTVPDPPEPAPAAPGPEMPPASPPPPGDDGDQICLKVVCDGLHAIAADDGKIGVAPPDETQ